MNRKQNDKMRMTFKNDDERETKQSMKLSSGRVTRCTAATEVLRNSKTGSAKSESDVMSLWLGQLSEDCDNQGGPFHHK